MITVYVNQKLSILLLINFWYLISESVKCSDKVKCKSITILSNNKKSGVQNNMNTLMSEAGSTYRWEFFPILVFKMQVS